MRIVSIARMMRNGWCECIASPEEEKEEELQAGADQEEFCE